MKSILLYATLAILLCTTPVLAHDLGNATSGPADIINFEWTVELSRTPKGDSNCPGNGCLRQGDTISVKPPKSGTDYYIAITPSGSQTYEFPARVAFEYDQSHPPKIERLVALFEDDIGCNGNPPRKALMITPVMIQDRFDQFSCHIRLARETGRLFPENLVRNSCQDPERNVIHWSIVTLDEGNCDGRPPARTFSPPDDGQGTGTGGN